MKWGFPIGFVVGAILATTMHGPDVLRAAAFFACVLAGCLAATRK